MIRIPIFDFSSLLDKKNKNDNKDDVVVDLSWLEEKKETHSWKTKLEKRKQELMKEKDYEEFKNDLEGLNASFKEFLKRKYGSLRFQAYFRRYESKVKSKILKTEFPNMIEEIIKKYLLKIEDLLKELKEEKYQNIEEKALQDFLIEHSELIEADLTYIDKEYRLGNSNYRGDLLFQDSNSKRLNIELKVIKPSFNKFKDQMTHYLDHIDKIERIMYIAPKITKEQIDFCEKNQIEFKCINLKNFFRRRNKY